MGHTEIEGNNFVSGEFRFSKLCETLHATTDIQTIWEMSGVGILSHIHLNNI